MSSVQTNARDAYLMVDEIKTLADRYSNMYDWAEAQEILRTIGAYASATRIALSELEQQVAAPEPDEELQEYQFNDPFDVRLARTPYLVLPKLAIRGMPPSWRLRFEQMLSEMEDAGIETPAYWVFRDDGPGKQYTRARCVNESTGFVRIVKGDEDPWANYRHGSVKELCPNYKGNHR